MNVQTKKRRIIKLIFITAAACLLYGISSGIRANYGILIIGFLPAVSTWQLLKHIQAANGYSLIWIVSMLLSGIAAIASFSVEEPINHN